jgi:hypothetical protein
MKQSPLFILITLIGVGCVTAAWMSPKSLLDSAQAKAIDAELPQRVLPDFASWPELRLKDIFKNPVGDLGLEYTDATRSLDGKQVRIVGFMSRSDWKRKDLFLLATFPLMLHDIEYGQADEIPPGAVLVKMPAGETAVHTQGPLMLAGTLRLGRFDAPGDRPIWAKLELHPDAKHWTPDPSLMKDLPEQERAQMAQLASLQANCNCRQCIQVRQAKK